MPLDLHPSIFHKEKGVLEMITGLVDLFMCDMSILYMCGMFKFMRIYCMYFCYFCEDENSYSVP